MIYAGKACRQEREFANQRLRAEIVEFERRDSAVQSYRGEIAADCGPFSTVSRKARKARLGGGHDKDRTCDPLIKSLIAKPVRPASAVARPLQSPRRISDHN
jgi:hypothetical protein